MKELSILIPARNEEWLSKTIQDILEHSEADTEVIAVLDGAWADPGIPQDPRVNVIYVPESVGQRAATNLAARIASGKYVIKCDAHCAFEQGFDRKMIDFMEKTGATIAAPKMRNLWVFDWKCYSCKKWRKYQGPTPTECGLCGVKDKIRKKMVWDPKERPQSWSYCFDAEPHFQYFEDYKHRPGVKETARKEGWSETMSLQGSFFMSSLKDYWRLKLSDEAYGSWGNQGIELACKAWLSGGKVLVNHNTWYAHMFRTQGGDFVPHYLGSRSIRTTKEKVWDDIVNGKIVDQIHPVSWLIEKFAPVPGWTDEKISELKSKEK